MGKQIKSIGIQGEDLQLPLSSHQHPALLTVPLHQLTTKQNKAPAFAPS